MTVNSMSLQFTKDESNSLLIITQTYNFQFNIINDVSFYADLHNQAFEA